MVCGSGGCGTRAEYLVSVHDEQLDDFGLVDRVDQRGERCASFGCAQQSGAEDDAQVGRRHVVAFRLHGDALQVMHQKRERRVVVARQSMHQVTQLVHHTGRNRRRSCS